MSDGMRDQQYQRFVIAGDSGTWGAGDTLKEAEKNRRKAGGKARDQKYGWMFLSSEPWDQVDGVLPYVDDMGCIVWSPVHTKYDLGLMY